MPKIEAWKCPHTGDIFEHKDAYERHLRRLAQARREQKRFAAIQEQKEATLAAFRAGLKDVCKIEEYVLEHQNMLWDFARTNQWSFDHRMWSKVPVDWYPVVEKIRFGVRYSPMVSNSHRAPLTGVTNWGGRTEGAPRGYPGYTGSVEWWVRLPEGKISKAVDTNIAGTLFSEKLVAINTGTGGGGGTNPETGLIHYRYGVEIFLDDWDGLKKALFLEALVGDKKVLTNVRP
jgi:hypothetical protein